MHSLKQIKSRLRTVNNIKKLTHGLEMISVSKLKRQRQLLSSAQAYADRLSGFLQDILSDERPLTHPFLERASGSQGPIVCLITSDTGLCGSYNRLVIEATERFLSDHDTDSVFLVTVGKKGFIYFKKNNFKILRSIVGLNGRYSDTVAFELVDTLAENFLFHQPCGVYLVYAKITGVSSYKAVVEKLLNIETPGFASVRHIFEPAPDALLTELISHYLFYKIKVTLLQAFCCEHQCRAVAMGESTQNAQGLFETLVTQRNKLRQYNITKEIIEIISSVEALRQ